LRKVLSLGIAMVICGCSGEAVRTVDQPPALSRIDVEHLLLRADDTRSDAFKAPPPDQLRNVFRGRALELLAGQAGSMGQRGIHEEERNASRTLIFWDPRAQEAVLQVIAKRRLVTPDDPDPPWGSTVRQWWARLEYADGRWWVVDQQDLAPDQWRSV
jgi:hypothetical protein